MEFWIGVNLGDVIVDGDQIYGDGVNVAARLESLAEPGGISISGIVHDQVKNKLALGYADLGEQQVKNIAEGVRVFRVLPEGTVAPRETRRIPRKYWRGGVLSLSGLAIIVATIFLVQHVSLRPPHTNASIPPAQSPALTLPDKPSIAVLPFINMSEDHEQEYFSDGITDDLITDLSRLPGLFVWGGRLLITVLSLLVILAFIGMAGTYVVQDIVVPSATLLHNTLFPFVANSRPEYSFLHLSGVLWGAAYGIVAGTLVAFAAFVIGWLRVLIDAMRHNLHFHEQMLEMLRRTGEQNNSREKSIIEIQNQILGLLSNQSETVARTIQNLEAVAIGLGTTSERPLEN